MGRVSVPEHDFSVRGGDVFVRGDRDVFYAVGVDGDHPRYTLTQHEDPMHENCGPCEAGLPEEMHSALETSRPASATRRCPIVADTEKITCRRPLLPLGSVVSPDGRPSGN